MDGDDTRRSRSIIARWQSRFADALDGIGTAIRSQESLQVHFAVAVLTILCALWLGFETWRWCVLGLCISTVIAAEMMNSALEQLVKTLHPERDANIAASLHMAAGAVLVTAIGAAAIGLVIYIPPLLSLLNRG